MQVSGLANLYGRWLLARHFPQPVLDALGQRIGASEAGHDGELVFAIEAAAPAGTADSATRALEIFGRLRVWDTPARTGVLLYLCLGEHAIEIVADRGVPVADSDWANVCKTLQAALRTGSYVPGLEAAIRQIEGLLSDHLGARGQELNVNLLPDAPVLI